jgi:hypothetical protein
VIPLFFAVYVGVVGAVAWLAAWLVRRWRPQTRLLAVAAALFAAGVFFTPVPIHGGVLILGPEIIRETWREWRRSRDAAADARREAHDAGRFAGWLAAEALGDGWRDPASGLVWSPAIAETPQADAASLADAGRRCAARPPAGYWAVPRNAEFFWLARTERAAGRWLADAYLWPEGISLPIVVALDPADAAGPPRAGQDARGAPLQVRCVAVTPPAPARGYRAADISLADWNAFQLRLVNGR